MIMNDIDIIFEIIKSAYQSLWKIKNHGNTIELITPMVTTNDMFVSVFITRRGDDFVVTDGGWIRAGIYECELDVDGTVFNRVFDYYLNSFDIHETSTKHQVFYYKKINDIDFLPNVVFDVSNFISSVVSAANIQFKADKVENSFKKRARTFLNGVYNEETFEYDHPVNEQLGVKFSAISHLDGRQQLINFVSGSTSTYFTNSLCRSMTNFEMIRPLRESLHVNKMITLIDDSQKHVVNTPQVTTYMQHLYGLRDKENKVVLWQSIDNLKEVLEG